ncbi:hypothetical protein DPX16_4460 [Anabarilius grahami]|uniref:Uncharacterized protein n=1 Tax=Anabarilius grahami TaxID=495550 RepID=A0A3N0XGC5_ANAGA|nr:hypothetical protein DPX16_4460 [Anabarilius grahami]
MSSIKLCSGDQYSLECLSNYLSNITCSLNISAESLGNESSYWLYFSTDDECRKDDYIPSPAPYFRDWDVDVQICSMLSGKVSGVMQGEESLQIDILTESTVTPPQLTIVCETSDQDDLTPQSPSMPHSPVWSEVDSGCWIRDFVPTEKGSITCSEDYCTLSNTYDI